MKRLTVILFVIAFVSGCAGGADSKAPGDSQAQKDLEALKQAAIEKLEYESRLEFEIALQPESVKYICDSLRKEITSDRLGLPTFRENAPAELKKPYEGWIFLSIYGKDGEPVIMAARDDNLEDACVQAMLSLTTDVKEKLGEEISDLYVKVDFTDVMYPVGTLAAARQTIVPGVHGIWLLPETRREYRLPSDMLEFSPADVRDILIYFSILPEVGFTRLFTTKAYLQEKMGAEPFELVRGLPPVPEITADVLKERVAGACEYFVRNQREDGSDHYLYAANRDKYLDVNEESLVRHTAGCAIMFIAGDAIGRKDFIESGEKSLRRVAEQVQRKNGFAYLLKEGRGTLGGSGLLLWALSRYRRVTGKRNLDDLAKEAAAFVLSLRKPDGTFCNFYDPDTGKPIDKPALYYQGEACYGLYWHYKEFDDNEALRAAIEAAVALSKQINRQYDAGGYPLDAWLMQAVRYLYPYSVGEQKREMLSACARMAEAMAGAVRTEKTAIHPDLAGSFRSSAQELPAGPGTAAMCEGLNEICLLLRELGEPTDKIEETLLRSARFQLRHQFWDDNMYFLPDPEKAKGGIKGTLLDNKVRIDHVQHAVGSWLGLLKIMQ